MRAEVRVNGVVPGDRVVSPFSGTHFTVESVKPGMYGLVELVCRDVDGNKHLLSLDPAEMLKRVS